MKRTTFHLLISVFLGFSLAVFSQENEEGIDQNKELEELETAKSNQKVDPIFPQENSNLILLEGEDAVSTNFTTEPILNYSCSGERTIQLSRSTGTSSNNMYYADFVFFVEKEGLYEFWYGGTPPGPSSDLHPSYASPFEYILDGSEAVEIFREQTTLVEKYAASYFWNYVRVIKLSTGRHKLRIQIKEKRQYDSRFFFYLDNIFFIRQVEGKRILDGALPVKFPQKLDDRSQNIPFKPIDDYLIEIRDNPDSLGPLLNVSMVYTMIGDYLNAVKYLKKALRIDPGNHEIQLLLAKNYIWRQDFQKGIDIYQTLLDSDPSKVDLWLEAGKITGWTGRYKDSLRLYENALKAHPDNINLLINQGLSLLWANKEEEANRGFNRAKSLGLSSTEKLLQIAHTFLVNGYANKAAEVYREGIKSYPDHLDFYLRLEDIYYNTGNKNAAMKVKENIEASFKESPQLTQYLDLFFEKISLKEKVIDEYRAQLQKEPDNLGLRELLAQALFWNGLKSEAVDEYLNILTNHAYRSFVEMQKNSADLLAMLDKCYTLNGYLNNMAALINAKKADISKQYKLYQKLISDYENYQAKVLKAQKEGKDLPAPEENPLQTIQNTVIKLASLLADGERISNDYQKILQNYVEDISKIRSFIEASQTEEEKFQMSVSTNNWKWNRSAYYDELQEVEKNGLVLAKHLLGRMKMFENDLGSGLDDLVILMKDQDYPQLKGAFFQALLWNGKTEDAAVFLEQNKKDIFSSFPYLETLAPELSYAFDSYSDSQGFIEKDTKAQIDRILEALNNVAKDIPAQSKGLKDSLEVLMDIMKKNMIRAFYRYEENNMALRNELGDFYLSQSKLDKAIKQYEMVRAIDPYDISALYRLGTVNQWNQNWSEAMKLYKMVFTQDPYYENTASLYNQLASQYADSLSLQSQATGDTSRQTWKMQADYTKHLSSDFTIHGQYQANYVRYLRSLGYGTDKHSFMYQTLTGGLEINLDFIKLEPLLGGHFLLHPLYYQQENLGFPDNFDFFEYITYHDISPIAKLKYTISPGTTLSLFGTAGIQQYEQTLSYYIDPVLDITVNANLFFALNFLPIMPLNKSTFQLSVNGDYLLDQHLIYNPSFQMNLPFLNLADSLIELAFLAALSYQDTLYLGSIESSYYYKPDQIFQGWGKISGKAMFGKMETGALEFTANTGGGISFGSILKEKDATHRVQIMAEGKVSYASNDFNLYLGSDFSTSYNLDAAADSNPWDYWSLSISLGYTSKMKNLLTQ
ncbi:MAG: tetratricopeptide repeat protein [Spirochaetales bacterium]|nr:tetratricopeptide repeat protein [Spirochaetales bacterium]